MAALELLPLGGSVARRGRNPREQFHAQAGHGLHRPVEAQAFQMLVGTVTDYGFRFNEGQQGLAADVIPPRLRAFLMQHGHGKFQRVKVFS